MKLIEATLTKLATDDGLVKFRHGYVGKAYWVVPERIACVQMENQEEKVVHRKYIIWDSEGTWLPMECLHFNHPDLDDIAKLRPTLNEPMNPTEEALEAGEGDGFTDADQQSAKDIAMLED